MKISLRKKKLKSGKQSLYIEYYKESVKDKDGKVKHNREFEYLGLYLIDNPNTPKEETANIETLELAEKILAHKKTELLTGNFNLNDTKKDGLRLYDYFETMKEQRAISISNHATWNSVKRYIEAFFHPSITLKEITPKLLENFKNYLDVEAKTKYGTLLKEGTKYSYFNRMKAVLNSAFEEGFITDNKVLKVKSFEEQQAQKEYLTLDELQVLTKTECKYPILKKAFLFSCLTGLRWSDIHKLKWADVRDTNEGSVIVFPQHKTNEQKHAQISEQARSIIGTASTTEETVFDGLIYNVGITNELLRWCMCAGITKHITFDSARYTAALVLLNQRADMTIVMKLAHKDIINNPLYTKVLDEKMKKAVNSIPLFNFSL